MWSVEYHVTTPSCVAMATSAASSSSAAASSSSAAASSSSATSSRHQCVGRAPGMLLEDVFELLFPNLVYLQLEAQWLNVHKRS